MITANKLTSIFAKLYGILALGKSEMNMNYKELRKDATRQGKQEVIFKEVDIQNKTQNYIIIQIKVLDVLYSSIVYK